MKEAIDTRIEVETPEHVVFPYRVAGPGPRGLAWLIDAVIRMALLAFLVMIIAVAGFSSGLSGLTTATILLLWFAMDWGWYTLFDALGEGRSPGRMLLSLRVIRDDGGPISWKEAILRNLLRPADAMPFGYVVGVLVSAVDPRFRRIGDLVAGTVVVHTAESKPPKAARPLPILSPQDLSRLPPRLRLGVEERSAVESWLEARERLGPAWGAAVAERVAVRMGAAHHLEHPDPVRLLELLAFAARLTSGPTLPPGAFKKLEAQLETSKLDPQEVSRLGWEYRALCAELGRRRTLLPSEQLAPLESLTARAHARLYRTPTRFALPDPQRLKESILIQFPLEFRRNIRFMAAAAALFTIPMILAAILSVGDSGFVDQVLPDGTREQMAEAYSTAPSRDANDNTMMAGFYVWNNVGIALRSVGAGMFGCLGTAWVLVYNGIVIGTVAGFLGSVGLGGNLLRFTSGHSAWELTALVIAGGAGLKLGWALIAPGGRTRLGALRAVGPSVAQLSGGAAVMLVVAASIEGFWSGQNLPDWARAAFGITNVLVVSLWLSGLGQGRLK